MSPSPIVLDGTIYLGGADGYFYAVKASTGEMTWGFKAEGKLRSSALATTDRVFFGSFDHAIYALDRKTGSLAWKFDTGSPVTTAPVLPAGRLVVGTRDKSLLVGLDPATGKPAWSVYYWMSWIESTPRVVDGLLYIGSSDSRQVRAIDPKDGSVKWATQVWGWTWGTPLVVGDAVYFATAGTRTYFSKRIPSLGCLERKTGALK